jgi:mono/diheme cytochrome c family protein
MSHRIGVVVGAVVWIVCATTASMQQVGPVPTAVASAGSPQSTRALLDRYCVTCHNDRLRTAGLSLQQVDVAQPSRNADVWEKVIRKLNARMMPPVGMPRPEAAAADGVVAYLEARLDAAATAAPNPGRPLLHRLNRAEYANAVRDLLRLEIDVSTLLPPDDSSNGFDNNADVLGVSPALLERYLSTAMAVAATAVGDVGVVPVEHAFRAVADSTQAQHIDGLPLGTRGGILIRHTFPVDGEYVIRTSLWRNNVGRLRGMEHPHQFEVLVDGVRVHATVVGTAEDFKNTFDDRANAAMMPIIDQRLMVRVPIKAGPRTIGVTFAAKTAALEPLKLRPLLNQADGVDTYGIPKVDVVTITGPYNVSGPGDTPSRRQVFECRPVTTADERTCARRIVSTLGRRAYRRPLADADLQTLLRFYDDGRADGGFDAGIQRALTRILASPDFLFRVERSPARGVPGTAYRISDLELASRLSFFLWSSIPDDELLQVAARGRLREPAVLEQQTRRMLADPRAQALVTNFAGQWLYLRNLRNVTPFVEEYPDFDDDLRNAFLRETEMLFESVMDEDRPVVDLLTADYTFLNERLARHYNIPNVYGTHFRRVAVRDEARRGLLGHGSILAVTSNANRTSPVRRGKWILENLMGTPPPAPPDNVPPLRENGEREKPLSMREQMEQHRANPACASCHKLMDPLGFALEQFDAVGGWRVRDAGAPIDAAVEMADGTTVNGPVELRRALLRRPETFVATLTEKLLVYALGRGLFPYDMPTVRGIVRDAARRDHRFTALILGIVNSTPFQMRTKA